MDLSMQPEFESVKKKLGAWFIGLIGVLELELRWLNFLYCG